MFRWASYIDHSVGGSVSWLWKSVYVWLWYPLAATLLPAELQLFLEGLLQHVFVFVVGPLGLRLLLVWFVHHIVGECANSDGRSGWRRKAARRTGVVAPYAVGTLFSLVLACIVVDFARSFILPALHLAGDVVAGSCVHVYQMAADVSAAVRAAAARLKKHRHVVRVLAGARVVLATLRRWAAWWRWLGGSLWRDFKYYYPGLRPILTAGPNAVEWFTFWFRFHSETIDRYLPFPLYSTIYAVWAALHPTIPRELVHLAQLAAPRALR
jgi:hypothetical protein